MENQTTTQENNKKTLKDIPFEEALMRLENLVKKMEEGKLPLEELTSDFEESKNLVFLCRKKLGDLERKIEILTQNENNEVEWKNFEQQPVASPNGARRNVSEEEF